MWDEAMRDGVLSWEEAKAILEKAGEKGEPEERPAEPITARRASNPGYEIRQPRQV
jgi:hypothetical protein